MGKFQRSTPGKVQQDDLVNVAEHYSTSQNGIMRVKVLSELEALSHFPKAIVVTN